MSKIRLQDRKLVFHVFDISNKLLNVNSVVFIESNYKLLQRDSSSYGKFCTM
jgi:hypothetical protein